MQAPGSLPATIDARLDDLVDTFDLLGNWEERYRHVIDLGRHLPALSDGERVEANKVKGCASQVWLVGPHSPGRPGGGAGLTFRGDSDAHIVRGLIAILLGLYNGAPAREILDFDARAAFARLGLTGALSQQRSNGLFSMVERIRRDAAGA